jgi:hypothetical protein
MTRLRALTTIAFAFAAVPLSAQTPTVAPAAAAPAPLTPAEEARFFALGKTYTRWFLSGKADSMLAVMAPETVEKVGGIDGMREMMNQIAERAGVETKMTEEKMTRRNGKPQFWHAGQFSEFADDELVIRWIFDADGKITGAGFGPKGSTPAPDPK